jgi:hypothetical protein
MVKTVSIDEIRAEKERFYEAFLAACKQLCEQDDEEGLWGAIAFCADNYIEKPEWVDDTLLAYAYDRLAGKPIRTRKIGKKRRRDLWIFFTVNYWRSQEKPFGKKGKPRRLSLDECLDIARKALEFNGNGEELSFDTIKKIYNRAKKRYASLVGIVEPL